ncbi:hypothetical protein NT6N_24460 [Oceaniferula spumae]|uniref:HEAT repeat domain-containing protein n=1 Tax=Oceaniferula spumae TaxID=2979115 RepID=A0AAT9FN16_9BACT
MQLDKQALHGLCDRLIGKDADAIEDCIRFIESDSEGIWHGRARAMMCRRLKHIALSEVDSDRLITSIFDRFKSGNFSHQFRDMLHLAIDLDRTSTLALARQLSGDSREFVRRQAAWIIQHHSEQK